MQDKSILPANLRMVFFEAVLGFMRRCGVDEAAVRHSFEEAFASYPNPAKASRSKFGKIPYIKTQNLPAQLLRVWHRNSKFIDQEARPRSLTLTQGRHSLRALMLSIDPHVDADATVRSMKKAGLIRRVSNGRYLPTSEAAIIDHLHPLIVEHVIRSVGRLISTVGRNSDPTGKSLSLIDRHAYTVDLDVAERKAFSEFSRSQGMACLESIDDWLEQRRVSRSLTAKPTKKVRKGVAAGVCLFAYLGDDEGLDSTRTQMPTTATQRTKHQAAPRTHRVK